MDLSLLRQTLESHLALNWSDTEICWQNLAFDQPQNAAWIKPAILPDKSLRPCLGSQSPIRQEGKLKIEVFCPVHQGTASLWSLIDALYPLFSEPLGPIRFLPPVIKIDGTKGNHPWYRASMETPWYFYG